MSRGFGKVQWSVLIYLAKVPSPDIAVLYEITVGVFGRRALSNVPRAQIESVRRALMALERAGEVELFYVNAPSGDHGWLMEEYAPELDADRTRRRQLAARLNKQGRLWPELVRSEPGYDAAVS